MEKISIDLLPPEFAAEEAKLGKFYKIQALGISIILLMIFLSIVLVSLRILQSNLVKSAQTQASEAEGKIASQSSKQASLMLLKSRLDTIQNYLSTPSKQVELYNLVAKLVPPTIDLSAVSVGADGTVLISALVPDVNALDRIFTDLLDKEKNKGKIAKVSIEALNRGKDGIFRVSFKVEAKK